MKCYFALGVLRLTSAFAEAPTKGPSVGCGSDCDDPGDVENFDDWNEHGYNGGISKVCIKVGAPKAIHSNDWIIRFKVCYGDDSHCVEHPSSTGGAGHADQCFEIREDELITEISGYAGGQAPRGENHGALAALRIHTSSGRQSDLWGGRHDGTNQFSIKAPSGEHIVAFWGRSSGSHMGWDGIIHKLGVYFGHGQVPPAQETCKDMKVHGYWKWVQMKGSGAEDITTSVGVQNADGTAGSTETINTLSNSEKEDFSVGWDEPKEFGGMNWKFDTSWETTKTESTSVSNSWSKMRTISYDESCTHKFSQEDGGHVYQWVWAYYCDSPQGTSAPKGLTFDACASMLLLPFTCPGSDDKCRPQFAPFDCADSNCQTGYKGTTNLKTGEVVGSSRQRQSVAV